MIIDSHAIVRQGLRRMLTDVSEIDVVGECADGIDALVLFREISPDIVIMDMNLASLNGVDLIAAIVRRCSKTRVIVLSGMQSESQAAAAFNAGAHAYVLKHSCLSALIGAVRMLRAGRDGYVDSQLDREQLSGLLKTARFNPAGKASCAVKRGLTPRERQVLQLVAEGRRNREIAECLHISIKTVETHRMNMMQKLDAHSTADIARWAMRLGLIHS